MREGRIRGTGRSRKKRGQGTVVFIVFLVIFFIFAGVWGFIKFMPNFKVVDFRQYFQIGERIPIVVEGEMPNISSYPVVNDGELYLPVDFVKEYVDPYIFWEVSSNKLTITTDYTVMEMKTDELTYYLNKEPMTLNIPVYEMNGIAYMPETLLTELYNIDIAYLEENNLVIVDYKEKTKMKSYVSDKRASVRYKPDIKSPIVSNVYQGEEFYIYGEQGNFYYVRLQTGSLGYINKKSAGAPTEIEGIVKEEKIPSYDSPKPIAGKINMVWEQMETVSQNSRPSSRKVHMGLDVLSPTWFTFERENYSGEIINIADLSYVNWAHNNGYQVWAMLSDSEDGNVTGEILSDANKREQVIKQILSFVSLYKLDGINIDFERVRESDIAYFHQFLRELSPMLKIQGATLSVDIFVPAGWSMYYDRGAIAKSADYICVMTYDENIDSTRPGPNASIPFVEKGIRDCLKEIPKEKLIMGIPFYSRVWIAYMENGTEKYEKRSLGMNYAYRMFTENGAELIWLDELGCYYGEFEINEDGVNKTYKTWLEDENSILKKLELVERYDIAGTAAWVRDLEKEEIWPLLYEKLK